MFLINARNVNDAYVKGLELVRCEGQLVGSRAGSAWTLPAPLSVVYSCPQERVLFDPKRDANPFFHLFESLWLLSGRNDAKWLDRFVHDFSSRFAEDDGTLHGSYGFRWRGHFDVDGGGNLNMPDQLDTVVRLLQQNPNDRRVVIQMWDPVADLGQAKRDVPCNLIAVPRIVQEHRPTGNSVRLDLTVFNRSNDMVWGMFGANAVQFSILQEYLAGRIGVPVGQYNQISTNAHVYEATMPVAPEENPREMPYPNTTPMGDNWGCWDVDLRLFMKWTETWETWESDNTPICPMNPWFDLTAKPLFVAHALWKSGRREEAWDLLANEAVDMSPDWRAAALAWMNRRLRTVPRYSKEGV